MKTFVGWTCVTEKAATLEYSGAFWKILPTTMTLSLRVRPDAAACAIELFRRRKNLNTRRVVVSS